MVGRRVPHRSRLLAHIVGVQSREAVSRVLSRPGNDGAETALRGWAYRIRTLMCSEKIHLFDKSREFGFT
jgi:hypothetical protein